MRMRIGVPLAAIFLLVSLTSLSQASSPIYIYSPVPNKSWTYNTPNHCDVFQGNCIARDIGGKSTGWTTDDPVAFSASSAANVTAKVVAATVNCGIGGPDNYVMLEIYGDGLYYGRVDYVHLRSLNVGLNQVISPGTTLGHPQTTASYYRDAGGNLVQCWTGLHVHVGTSYNGWASSGGSYSTPMLTFPQGIGQRPIRSFNPANVPHPQAD